jgi:hypothetical protein
VKTINKKILHRFAALIVFELVSCPRNMVKKSNPLGVIAAKTAIQVSLNFLNSGSR